MSKLSGITATMIFEASALNRDEKIGGNIPSIKKLTRYINGETMAYSFISKEAMRNYLFESLQKLNSERWKETPVFESGRGENKVIQFDLKQANILTHAELDAFGYMFTIEGQTSITRKGTVTPTKAISLEPWNGDMQFNANVGLARRCNGNPNPTNEEEQYSYFKVSFTIEVDRFGFDEWWVDNVSFNNNKLIVTIAKNVVSEIGDITLYGQDSYIRNNEFIEIKNMNNKNKVIFKVSNDTKKERINDILTVIKNGLCYHSGGENYGIVPKFLIIAGLSMPVPLFHSFVELGNFENSILDNEYILKNGNGRKLIYVCNPKNLVGEISCDKIYSGNEWDDFVNILKSKIENSEENNANSQN